MARQPHLFALVMTVFDVVGGFPIALSAIVNAVLVCFLLRVVGRRIAEQVGQQVGARFWRCLSVGANSISDRG